MSKTGCECTGPGFCQRHGIYKGPGWFRLCQNAPGYFAAWEQGRGPGQNIPPPEVEVSRCAGPPGGPGTELARLLWWFGLKDRPECPCKAKARQMDHWGPEKCLQNLDRIVRWLRHEAKVRKLPFSRKAAQLVVVLAIRRAERARKDFLAQHT